ncbi:MAG: 30S ribosomal protein S3 [candidate division WS6 bacterium GW2011_GWF2_39_15]|uniref:Small ribosomal subunit protein uS3 n=1 Tax=candidate division WS6 bacterium GW2011_GWF2_39_15 TaxID=1619100 RepID=A0A0G0QVK7_9BACT|nr:MAG: 30S ribosomal protein S3 [candidate division WS6 bacterium GW2011_GWF2_39_15]
MGNKIVPTSVRLGVNKTWESVWFAKKKDFGKALMSDIMVRKEIEKVLNPAGLDHINLYKSGTKLDIEVFVARPGVAIGRGGSGIDDLQKHLKKLTKCEVDLRIKEVKKPDISARIIARSIADGIERRQPSKLLIAAAKEKAMLSGAKGIKILVSGRINNASQARSQKDVAGPVPAQTLKANIDYAEETAATSDAGLFGVKVWVYKEADKLEESNN